MLRVNSGCQLSSPGQNDFASSVKSAEEPVEEPVKDGAGAVKVETVLEEIATLNQLRALGLPAGLC
jgi:hypothetical protein